MLLDLRCLELAIERRLDPTNPKIQRWVGREKLGSKSLAEKQMRRFLGIIRLHDRFLFPTADPFQRSSDPKRIACELNRGGIGKKFALTRHGRLDQSRKENSGIADPQKQRPKNQYRHDQSGRTLAIIIIPARGAHGHVRSHSEQTVSEHRNQQDPMQKTQDPYVESHVPIEDVAELMRNDPLKLIAREGFDASAGDSHDRVLRGRSGRKRIDPQFAFQQVHRRYRRARGQSHLLDDVEQNTLIEVPTVGLNLSPP